MNNNYEWDESIIPSRGLSLTGRVWARLCPAKHKLAGADDPVAHINRIELFLNLVIGFFLCLILGLVAMAMIYLPWLWALPAVVAVAAIAGVSHVAIGAGHTKQEDLCAAMAALFPLEAHGAETVRVAAQCSERVWGLEIISQVAGSAGLAHMGQHLMDQTVEAAQDGGVTPVRRI